MGGVICISEVIDTSSGNLDSSLCSSSLGSYLRSNSLLEDPLEEGLAQTPGILPGGFHALRRLPGPRVGQAFGFSRHTPSLFLLLPVETLLFLLVLLRCPLLSTPACCPPPPGGRLPRSPLLRVHELIQAGGCSLAEPSMGSVSLEQEALTGRAVGSQTQMLNPRPQGCRAMRSSH